MQTRFAWPPRKDDTHKSRSVNNFIDATRSTPVPAEACGIPATVVVPKNAPPVKVHTHIYIYIYVFIIIYIYIEREILIDMCVYIYIYTYTLTDGIGTPDPNPKH